MSRITKVEVGRFDYDFVGSFKFFPPDGTGRVRRPSVLVRLTDEEGVQGWGQAVPVPTWTYETVESASTTLTHYLAPAVLGLDPADLAAIHNRMDQAIRPGLAAGQPLAKAAVDLACYDLVGRRQNCSASELLGGAQTSSMTLSWTVASADMAVVEAQLEEGQARGYQHFNFKVGPPQTPEYDLELARCICRFAPDSFLWADANTGYTLKTALEMLPRLADEGVQVIESPLPPMQIRGYQRLRQQGALPIFMDEGIVSPQVAEEFIALGMVDGLTLKTARSGGLWPSSGIVRRAQEQGVKLLGSGLSDPDLSLLASLHLFAWAGIDKPCALNGPQFLGNTLLREGWQVENGKIAVPSGPGVGAELTEQAAAVLTLAAELF